MFLVSVAAAVCNIVARAVAGQVEVDGADAEDVEDVGDVQGEVEKHDTFACEVVRGVE